jgi:hypothetical protein
MTFYVKTWGGIRSIGDARLNEYIDAPVEDLAGGDLQGVASWSKVLTATDPDAFVIYDARVALELNLLQLDAGGPLGVYFPLLPSQNSRVGRKAKEVRDAIDAQTLRLPKAETYRAYIRALTLARGETTLERAEMTLFCGIDRRCPSSRRKGEAGARIQRAR